MSRICLGRRRPNFVAQVETLEPRCLLAGLLHQADLAYLGAFRLPGGTFGASSFDFGGAALAYNPANNSLFMVGHSWHQAVAEVNIPTLKTGDLATLNTATVRQNFVDIVARLPNMSLPNPGFGYGSLLVVDGQIYGALYEYYDAESDEMDSHFKLSSTDLTTAEVSGLYQVGTMGGGWVGGWMTTVPTEWQDDLGSPYLTGQGGLPIINRTSWGTAAFGIDLAQIGPTPAPAVPFLYYTGANPLGPIIGAANELWNGATSIKGVVFPNGSDSVLFFGSHGTGESWYGTPPSEGTDPLRGDKGYHAYPYRYQVWAYSAHDLAAVKNGLKQPWEVLPYDVWELPLPYDGDQIQIGGVAYDEANNRLYVSQKSADAAGLPIIHAFQLDANTPDARPPVISQIASTDVASNKATIKWFTNESSDTQVEYGTNGSYGNTTTLNPTLITSHVVGLFELGAGTTYHYRVKSRDSAGNLSVSDDFTFTTLAPTPSVTDWGTIAFSNFNNRNMSGAETWYSFTTTRSGKGTVEAFFNHAAGNVDLAIYNSSMQLLGSSATAANAERVDLDVIGSDVYFVKFSGVNPDVDVRVTNLVGIAGTAISVFGTTADDTFRFVHGTSHEVSVNGISYAFAPSEVGQVSFSGDGGNDVLQVSLGILDDAVTLRPGQLDITSPAYSVQGNSVESINVDAGTGLDKVWLYDTAGNDTFTATPTSAQFTGTGMNHKATGFDEVRAYGTVGGTDIANLYDSSGNDYFDAGPASGLLRGPGFYSYAERFDKVFAYSTAGGYDIAKLYDSIGNDYFDAGPASGLMQGSGFYNWAELFDEVIANSTAGGSDTANLYGSAGNDLFSIADNRGTLAGSGYLLSIDQFEQSQVYGQGGSDTAQFRELLSVDKVYGRGNYARLTVSNKKTTVYDLALAEGYAKLGQKPIANVRNVDYLFRKFGTWR